MRDHFPGHGAAPHYQCRAVGGLRACVCRVGPRPVLAPGLAVLVLKRRTQPRIFGIIADPAQYDRLLRCAPLSSCTPSLT
jgi:hypothetical protein